jgi:hypothetical protein
VSRRELAGRASIVRLKSASPRGRNGSPFRDSADCFRTPAPLRVPKDQYRAAPPRDAGEHKRVLRMMRKDALLALRRRRFVVTTNSSHNLEVYREAVGWALDRTLAYRLTIAALERAIAQRRPRPGLAHHSDRGLQYARGEYVAIPEKYGWSIDQQAAGRRQRIHGEWRRRQGIITELEPRDAKLCACRPVCQSTARIPSMLSFIFPPDDRLHYSVIEVGKFEK